MYFKKIKRTMYKRSVQFRTRMIEYKFVSKSALERNEEMVDQHDPETGRQWIESLIEEVMAVIWKRDNIHPSDRVAMSLYGGDLNYPVTLPLYPYHSASRQRARLMEEVSKIQQSKREWLLGTSLEINVIIVEDLRANGRRMKNNKMTTTLFDNALARGLIAQACSQQSDLNLTSDVRAMVTRYANLNGLDAALPQEEDDWMTYLNQWCSLHPEVNVMVLHLPGGMNTPHSIKWKSCTSSLHHSLVLWNDEVKDDCMKYAFLN